jgi:hypothetical protein
MAILALLVSDSWKVITCPQVVTIHRLLNVGLKNKTCCLRSLSTPTLEERTLLCGSAKTLSPTCALSLEQLHHLCLISGLLKLTRVPSMAPRTHLSIRRTPCLNRVSNILLCLQIFTINIQNFYTTKVSSALRQPVSVLSQAIVMATLVPSPNSIFPSKQMANHSQLE